MIQIGIHQTCPTAAPAQKLAGTGSDIGNKGRKAYKARATTEREAAEWRL